MVEENVNTDRENTKEKQTVGNLLTFLKNENVKVWKDGVHYEGKEAMELLYNNFGIKPVEDAGKD